MKKENTFIEDIISKMTLTQKVGAVMTLAFTGVVPKKHTYDYITKYHCGGLRLTATTRKSISYVDPRKTSGEEEKADSVRYAQAPYCTASEYKAVLKELQKVAKERPLSIPLHFSLDQEGSTTSNFCFGGATLFTKPMGIRAANDSKMAYLVARAIGEQCRAVGYNWVHSPVLDINSDPKNPEICTRAYSDDADEVALYAAEACRGYKDAGMIATGKHFPGRGCSASDAHYDIAVIDVDEETLWERELLPYKKLIEQDLLPSIMIAHSIFPAIDPEDIATVSKPIITGLLREKLGYEGVITTDSMTMGGVIKRYGVANACAMALEAGADIVLMKAEDHLVDDTFNTIKSFVESGRITESDLDDKIYRILNMKYNYGLFDDFEREIVPEDVLKREDIAELSKEVANRSVLICRDEDKLLPLKSDEKILVIEQKNGNFNDFKWHSGILYENCLKHSMNTDYIETAYRWDDFDLERIKQSIENYDKVVITNYYSRSQLCNMEEIKKLTDGGKGNIIVVTNTPYEEISVPKNAKSVIVTFASSPDNIKVVADTLFGKTVPGAVWPVSHHA